MMDLTVPYYDAVMETFDAGRYPRFAVPAGFTISGWREGFEHDWARIECAAEGMRSTEYALGIFRREFPDEDLRRTRCLFALNASGVPVATASLWPGDTMGDVLPRVHYVATDPAYDGLGLCKALLTALFDVAAAEKLGDRIYLTTQSPSYPAIGLYLQFGFRPVWKRPVRWHHDDFQPEQAWLVIRERLAAYYASLGRPSALSALQP